ncbi:MAG: hypothetical protein WC743_23950 [Mucilaginibacter sp.]|jgi:hypothetical protein
MANENRTRLPLTVTLDGVLKKYIDPKTGPFHKKSLIKPTQFVEKAIEELLKSEGYWDHYQAYRAEQVEEVY